MENLSTIISAIALTTALAGGFFKIWIISPLTNAVDNLNRGVDEMQTIIDNMKEKDEETRKSIAVLEARVNSLLIKVDKLEEKFTDLQERQIKIVSGGKL